jgi:hypothetical protein
MEAVRRVHVKRVWCAPGTASDPKAGLSLYAHVEAVGLKWRSIRVEVELRTLEGKPVQVAEGAPEGYADKTGRFSMSTRVPVFDDRFEWPELRASIPYERVLDLPAERPWRLIATLRASCEGLASVCEAEITVPPAPAPGVKRALRVLAIDAYPNSPMPDEPQGAHQAASRGGPRAPTGSTRGASRSRPASPQRGLMVEGYVAAEGLGRAKIVGRLVLKREEAGPRSAEGPEKGGRWNTLSTRSESDVVSDQAQILLHFFGQDVLALEPGWHRVILSYTATSAGLKASLAEEHVLPVAAAATQ